MKPETVEQVLEEKDRALVSAEVHPIGGGMMRLLPHLKAGAVSGGESGRFIQIDWPRLSILIAFTLKAAA